MTSDLLQIFGVALLVTCVAVVIGWAFGVLAQWLLGWDDEQEP